MDQVGFAKERSSLDTFRPLLHFILASRNEETPTA